MFFHCIDMVKKVIHAKTLKRSRSCSTRMHLDYSVQQIFEGVEGNCRGCQPWPACQVGLSVHFVRFKREPIPRIEQLGPNICTKLAVALSALWKRRCQPRYWCGQSGVDQTSRAGLCVSVCHLTLFGAHCFGGLQQNSLQNAERLDHISSVRSADKQTASYIKKSIFFRGNYPWRNTPITFLQICHRCQEYGFRDVKHSRLGCWSIACI